MKAKERLYLTGDKQRVTNKPDDSAAFLLAGSGCEIPQRYEALVTDFYSKGKPKAEPDEALDTLTTGPPEEDVIENRETRIPKVLRKRGRPRLDPETE